jgi:hypothetical protein
VRRSVCSSRSVVTMLIEMSLSRCQFRAVAKCRQATWTYMIAALFKFQTAMLIGALCEVNR